MAITYFGFQTGVTVSAGLSAALGRAAAGYACPGTGAQTVKALEFKTEWTTEASTEISMGIYPAGGGGNLICETTAKKFTGLTATPVWVGWNNTEITWYVGTTLTGGTTYVLAIASDATIYPQCTESLPNGTWHYNFGDVAGALTTPEPAGNDHTTEVDLRCGVEPAASGVSIPLLMGTYRRRRA